MSDNLYSKFGASASKAGMKGALARAGIALDKRYFAPLIEDIAGSAEHAGFIHCDGAGTKSIIAYLEYKISGSAKAFHGIAQDALVMNVDDVFCIGEPERIVLANLIARNAHRVGDDVIETVVGGYRRVIEQLASHGISIEMSGGETADCGDVVQTILVDAVISGRIARSRLIETSGIRPGDVILGLSSTGQTSYEDAPNSGIGSNGLTLARHVLLSGHYMKEFPEIVADRDGSRDAYVGPYMLEEEPEGLGMKVGEALLSPTRTYSPALKKIYETLQGDVHSVIHNTGGGQTKVMGFAGDLRIVKDNLFPTPPVFTLIQEAGNVPWKEMLTVFNMGHRMEIYLPAERVSCAQTICHSLDIETKVVGHVEKHDKPELVIAHSQGTFTF